MRSRCTAWGDVDRPAVARAGLHVRHAQPRRLRAPLDRDGDLRRGGVLDRCRRRTPTGAGARAIWVMFLPVLVAAPWAWSIRAQMLALPLYTGLLWLLAIGGAEPDAAHLACAPDPRRLGEPPRKRRPRRVARDAPRRLRADPQPGRELAAQPALARSSRRSPSLATPYGPVETARYYHLLLVDPPFAGRITEWSWSAPAVETMCFYALAAITVVVVWLGRRRLTPSSSPSSRSRSRGRQRDPRNRVVRARLHGVRPGRDRT